MHQQVTLSRDGGIVFRFHLFGSLALVTTQWDGAMQLFPRGNYGRPAPSEARLGNRTTVYAPRASPSQGPEPIAGPSLATLPSTYNCLQFNEDTPQNLLTDTID